MRCRGLHQRPVTEHGVEVIWTTSMAFRRILVHRAATGDADLPKLDYVLRQRCTGDVSGGAADQTVMRNRVSDGGTAALRQMRQMGGE